MIDRARRWLYRGGHPHQFTSLLNAAQVRLATWGIGPSWLAVLEVTGRRTGRTVSLPVVVAEFEGEQYLVSMLGNDASWPRNVRAANGRAVLRRRRHRVVVNLRDVDVNRRAPILRCYLQRAFGARAHIPVPPDAPLADFERIAAQYPVFEVVADCGSS